MTVYVYKHNEMLLVFCEIGWIPNDKLIFSRSFPSHDSMSPKYPVLFGVFCNKADDILIKAWLGWSQAPSARAGWSDKKLLGCYSSVETRASWGLAVMVLPAGCVHTGPDPGNEKKIGAGKQERSCWDHLVLAGVAGQWLSLHLSVPSLCWPVALRFHGVLQNSVIALCLSWPGLCLIMYTYSTDSPRKW